MTEIEIYAKCLGLGMTVAGAAGATAAGTNTVSVTAEVSDISLTAEYKGTEGS